MANTLTFEQFFWAIAQQESGGNYGAVGVYVRGDRAYGKYQVMGNNIPSWTKAYLGKSLTPQQFLNSPSAQEAVAKGRLKSYYNKYGDRGAASAWYSGNPNLHSSTRSQSGGPSIKSYVDSVLRRGGGAPSGGSSSTSGGGEASGGPVVPKLNEQELAEQYGFTSGFLNANPELKKLMKSAVAGGWADAKFMAKLRDTKWFKSHSKTERDYLTRRYTDPASAKQDLSQATVKARQIANALGIRESGFTMKKINEAAYNLVAKGWNESQLRFFLGQFVFFDGQIQQGEGGEIWDQLNQYSYNMGVKMSEDWMSKNARSILQGVSTIQDMKNEIARVAKAQFPQWSKQIDGGQTVADLAQPYLSSMSQILELPAGSINLFDPTVKKAMNYTNPTNLAKEAMPLWAYEEELRKDSRWKKTKNAQDSLMQIGHQVLADFGVKY